MEDDDKDPDQALRDGFGALQEALEEVQEAAATKFGAERAALLARGANPAHPAAQPYLDTLTARLGHIVFEYEPVGLTQVLCSLLVHRHAGRFASELLPTIHAHICNRHMAEKMFQSEGDVLLCSLRGITPYITAPLMETFVDLVVRSIEDATRAAKGRPQPH